MAKRKIMIYLATVVLTIGVLTLCLIQRKTNSPPFSIQISTENGTETIDLWEKERGEYYAFLPSYAGAANMTIRMNTDNAVRLNGEKLWDGMSCDTFVANVPYDLIYSAWCVETHSTVTFLYSANIATMYVDTQSGSMEYIHREKGNEESGTMRLYTNSGMQDYKGGLVSINGRGNATWTISEKKPYSLTLTNEANLLEMGTAKKWILLANAMDPSNMRNKIVFEFSKKVGLQYSPGSEWVDLYLNGEYAGLYLLCERNEVHPERVNISDFDSFLVSLEFEDRLIAQNYPYVITEAKQSLRIHYPNSPSNTVLVRLNEVWQSVENALLAKDSVDPTTGKHLAELIDLDSWAKKYLVEEIFGSVDACLISQYFYSNMSEQTGIIFAGPVWDFDNSMGNRSDWRLRSPKVCLGNQLHNEDGWTAPWFYELYKKDFFYNRIVSLYQSEFMPLLETEIPEKIKTYSEHIDEAAEMNQYRWNMSSGTFQDELQYIINYMDQRIQFLTSMWLCGKEYYYVYADYGLDCCNAVVPGECFSELYNFGERDYGIFLGWYYKDTNEPFDPDRPITEDIEIYAKWQDKPTKKLDQLLKLVPLGVIAVMGVGLLWVEVKRWKRRR